MCVRYRGNSSGTSGCESSGSVVTNTREDVKFEAWEIKGLQRLSIQQRKSDLTTCLYHVVIKRIPFCECRISIASALQQLLRWREAVVKSVPLEVSALGVNCQLAGLVLGFSKHVLVSCRLTEQINESERCMIPTAGIILT